MDPVVNSLRIVIVNVLEESIVVYPRVQCFGQTVQLLAQIRIVLFDLLAA